LSVFLTAPPYQARGPLGRSSVNFVSHLSRKRERALSQMTVDIASLSRGDCHEMHTVLLRFGRDVVNLDF
jgi:hypothetical protein